MPFLRMLRRVGRRRRPRLSATTWLVPFLAATLALAAWLGYQAQDAVRSHRSAAESALRDYAHMAAWEYSGLARENLGDLLESAFDEVPRRVRRRGLPGPWVVRQELEEELQRERCACAALADAAYFRIDLRGGARVLHPDTFAPELGARLLEMLSRKERAQTLERTGFFIMAAGALLNTPALIAYAVTSDSVDAHTVYGFAARADAFSDLFARWYHEGELLPPAIGGGIANDSLLHVAVTAATGATLFESEVEYPRSLVAADTIDARYASLIVEASVRPDAASRLIIGGLPASKLPLIVALLLLTLGVGAVALGQLRRERELGHMRDDFISGVSHELRTPLAQIRMFAELDEGGKLRTPEERRRATRAIHRESKRLTHLVENILRFSRLRRAPGESLLREEIPLATAIDELVESYEPLADTRGVKIRTVVPAELTTVASRDALNQIMVNLLDNAVKYGPTGQTVTVRAMREGGRVRLTVDDEGPGVPPQDRRRVWEPYRRLERDVQARRPGTGIGLAVVAELTALHGGRAWIEDAPGGGARFVVELAAGGPRASSASAEAERTEVHA
jgi:signal transduction histidine kinase